MLGGKPSSRGMVVVRGISIKSSPLSVSAPSSSARATHCSSMCKGHGRITRKDLRMHKLVFEENVLPDGTELSYVARGQVDQLWNLLQGYKKGCGIFCFCCQTEVSPSQFEAHAGWASRRKPYLHIYTSNGVSLHELSSPDVSKCLAFPEVPQGTWHCKRKSQSG